MVPKKIVFNVAVTPNDAVVSVDDKPFSAGSVSAQLDADGVRHRVRIQAPDYKPFEAEYVFDKQINLAINLTPIRPTHPRRDTRERGVSQPIVTPVSSAPSETDATSSPSGEPGKEMPSPNGNGDAVPPVDEKALRPIDMDAPW